MKSTSLMLALSLSLMWVELNAGENALVISHQDQNLQWAPCPDFMPKGCEIAVLQGDPAQKNADVFLKIPADSEIPNHMHTSEERIVLVSGTLDVMYDNRQKVTIQTGDYAYGPAKMPHSAYCHQGETCVLYIGFVEPLDAIPVESTATR